MKWFFRVVQAVFVLVLLGGAAGCWLAWQMFAPGRGGTERLFELRAGETVAQLAVDLEDRGYVRSALAFRLLVKATHAAPQLRAGSYKLSAAMSPYEIIEVFKKGPPQEPGIMVTIPEGKTLKEVAAIVQARTGIPAQDFELLAETPRKLFPKRTWLPERGTAEGYLFPDTYNVPKGARASQVMDLMLARFEQAVLPSLTARSVPPVRLKDVITMASLVEAEAQVAGERSRIAAVYYNRLRTGMRLECDATVQYALGKRKPVLTYDDLKIQSTYNTYQFNGLPPGPICNPGLACITAALTPTHDDSLYYVRNDRKNDGSHVFSKTFAQHEAAIRAYQLPQGH